MDEWFGFGYEGTAGERCDIAVVLKLRELPEFAELSRTRVQALIEAGGVLYDGKEIPRGQKKLRPGMHVEVNLTRLRELLRPPALEHIEPLDLPLEFMHTDEHIAVVVKPPGLSVHPSATEHGPTLTAALLHHLGKLSDMSNAAGRPGIVHRLDKETSGLLVVARDNAAHAALSRQFANRVVEKEYLALCIDPPGEPTGRIDSPIERHPRQRQRMWSRGGGRSALTEYRLAEMWGPLALLDVSIHTGRTHQIRVHLLEAGACILGDEKYSAGRNASLFKFLRRSAERATGSSLGGQSVSRAWREACPDESLRHELLRIIEEYPGIFLHAKRLAIMHPATGKRMEFTSQPPHAWQLIRELFPAQAGKG